VRPGIDLPGCPHHKPLADSGILAVGIDRGQGRASGVVVDEQRPYRPREPAVAGDEREPELGRGRGDERVGQTGDHPASHVTRCGVRGAEPGRGDGDPVPLSGQRERPDCLRDQGSRELERSQLLKGSSSSISARTRASSSSRIPRTASTSWPAGSSSAQSSYRLPG